MAQSVQAIQWPQPPFTVQRYTEGASKSAEFLKITWSMWRATGAAGGERGVSTATMGVEVMLSGEVAAPLSMRMVAPRRAGGAVSNSRAIRAAMAGVCAHMCRMARVHLCCGDACMRDTWSERRRAGPSDADAGTSWGAQAGAYAEASELLGEQDPRVAAGELGGAVHHGPRHGHAHQLAVDLSELGRA